MTTDADWLIDRIMDRGPGSYYRFQVEGVNVSTSSPRRFVWSVRDIRSARFAAHPNAPLDVADAVMRAKQYVPK